MPRTVNSYPPDGGFDPSNPRGQSGNGAGDGGENTERENIAGVDGPQQQDEAAGPDEAHLLKLAEAARQQSISFGQRNWRNAWDMSYKAFRSEYIDKSKYKSDDYRHRSKIFRPKTRIAVTKDMAGAAQALFNNTDMVSCQASDQTDPKQEMNAELTKALIEYRLDRTSGKNAIAWFLIAMGALQDCKIAGICVSKSFWEYQEKRIRPKTALLNSSATPTDDALDGETRATRPGAVPGDLGESFADDSAKSEPQSAGSAGGPQSLDEAMPAQGAAGAVPGAQDTKIVKDKPEIELFPPENVGLDPAASWIDPVQSGAYFYVKIPMHVQDVKDMMNDPRTAWRGFEKKDGSGEADEEAFKRACNSARVEEFTTSDVRRAREGGQDRMDNSTSSANEFDVIWVYEWFIRDDDEDWNFWTLGADHMLSTAVPTEDSYPWRGGDRPYDIGYGNLEAHRIVPQSPVETWQPLQQEINDVTNLSLDSAKQAIMPVALVKRGKKIDTDALKRRYPILFVENPKEDVQWDRPPSDATVGLRDMAALTTDFDDLTGTFNGGSVSSNRQVGETVGGMRLMAGAAGGVSEFYLRLFVETWVERVLSNLAKLEAFYESDEKILAICKKRAPSFLKYGVDEITDELLAQEVIVRVSASIGAADPMQKMAKLGQAFALAAQVVKMDPRFVTGEYKPNTEAFMNEIFGNAGQRDAWDRFFEVGEAMPQPGEQPQPNPDADPAVLADKQADRTSKENIAKLNAKTKITSQLIAHKADRRAQHHDHKDDGKHKFMDVMMEALSHHRDAQERQADRAAGVQKPSGFPAAAA